MTGERATDSSLEMFDKRWICYTEVWKYDTVCKQINKFFGFLKPENIQNLNEYDLDICVNIFMEKYTGFFTADLKFEIPRFQVLWISRPLIILWRLSSC